MHVPEFTKSLGQDGEQVSSEVSEPRTAPWSPPDLSGEPRDKAQTANQKRRSRAE